MQNLSNWDVSVGYGPLYNDKHYIVVKALNLYDAIAEATKWATAADIDDPDICVLTKFDYDSYTYWDDETYDDVLDIPHHTVDDDNVWSM